MWSSLRGPTNQTLIFTDRPKPAFYERRSAYDPLLLPQISYGVYHTVRLAIIDGLLDVSGGVSKPEINQHLAYLSVPAQRDTRCLIELFEYLAAGSPGQSIPSRVTEKTR
jgi:hypothetical protein